MALSVNPVLLEVAYEHSAQETSSVVQYMSPSMIVHLGVSSKAEYVRLERFAVNCRAASIPDTRGRVCEREPIDVTQSLSAKLETQIDLDKLQQRLLQQGRIVQQSEDAGTYVCNSLYWESMTAHNQPVLFIHIPKSPKGGLVETIRTIQLTLLALVDLP